MHTQISRKNLINVRKFTSALNAVVMHKVSIFFYGVLKSRTFCIFTAINQNHSLIIELVIITLVLTGTSENATHLVIKHKN